MQPSHCCECRGLVGAHADQQLPSNDRASHHAASKLTVPKTSFELIWRGGRGSARTYWCVRSTTQKSSRTTSPRREYAKTGVCSGGKTERRCRSLQQRAGADILLWSYSNSQGAGTLFWTLPAEPGFRISSVHKTCTEITSPRQTAGILTRALLS